MADWGIWRVRLLGAGVVGALLVGPGVYELVRLSLMERKLDRRLAELQAERERLLKERARLTSDEPYVEGLIRSTFKVAKPGEWVVPPAGDDDRGTP